MLWLPCSVSSLLAHPILGFCVGQNQFVEDLIPCPIVPVEIFLSRLREREGLNWRVLHMDGHLEWTFTYTMILHIFILCIFMEHPQGARLWYWTNLTKTLTLWSEDSQGEPDHGWVNKDDTFIFFSTPHHAASGILVLLTRDQTRALWTGSMESQPLDRQGISKRHALKPRKM